MRAAELKKWSETRDHQRIMDGHYPRRDEDKDTSVTDAFKESASHYADSVRSSKDPLMKLVGDIAGGMRRPGRQAPRQVHRRGRRQQQQQQGCQGGRGRRYGRLAGASEA